MFILHFEDSLLIFYKFYIVCRLQISLGNFLHWVTIRNTLQDSRHVIHSHCIRSSYLNNTFDVLFLLTNAIYRRLKSSNLRWARISNFLKRLWFITRSAGRKTSDKACVSLPLRYLILSSCVHMRPRSFTFARNTKLVGPNHILPIVVGDHSLSLAVVTHDVRILLTASMYIRPCIFWCNVGISW